MTSQVLYISHYLTTVHEQILHEALRADHHTAVSF